MVWHDLRGGAFGRSGKPFMYDRRNAISMPTLGRYGDDTRLRNGLFGGPGVFGDGNRSGRRTGTPDGGFKYWPDEWP